MTATFADSTQSVSGMRRQSLYPLNLVQPTVKYVYMYVSHHDEGLQQHAAETQQQSLNYPSLTQACYSKSFVKQLDMYGRCVIAAALYNAH